MAKIHSKLILGSANFGLDYGLTNASGKISDDELRKILIEAKAAGIEMIDTAQAYGNSEVRLGSLLSNNSYKIITKINSGLEQNYHPNSVLELVKKSCERLDRPHLHAVMFHRPEVLIGHNGKKIIRELEVLKAKNMVSKIGLSIYSPEILREIPALGQLDIIQAPFNVIDQQILSSGWAAKLKDSGIEIHTRSTFLQGLLLLKKSKLPKYFEKNWPSLFETWFEFLKTNGYGATQTALSFVLRQPWIEKVVVGVDSASQLRSLLEIEKSIILEDFPKLQCCDENLINPSRWELS